MSTSNPDPGSLVDTPLILASSDPDPHVPWERVDQTVHVLRKMGAEIELIRYPGMGHLVSRAGGELALVLYR